ncbi:type II toxin-antitoxin system VapC family toxin [Lonepinella sp. BR2271]|uniref:type II toxin-antitoxin system VapC family toxin n=1 Tax=Lonepinella sp. BR2271 TaxID=3434550 RepID=UPI003F6E2EE5
MQRYLLDTNTVSYAIKGHANVLYQLQNRPMASICISSITYAELKYGLAKRPEAKKLHTAVNEFLARVDILAFNQQTGDAYAKLRAESELSGKNLSALDMLIASHAYSVGAILVTSDNAFKQIRGLQVEDWTHQAENLPIN